MNIYVGNLSWEVSEEDLLKSFGEFGQVTSARIISDSFTGKSRGFAFVEMADKAEAEAAIKALNNKEIKGRAIRVNEARPKGEGGDRKRGGGSRW